MEDTFVKEKDKKLIDKKKMIFLLDFIQMQK